MKGKRLTMSEAKAFTRTASLILCIRHNLAATHFKHTANVYLSRILCSQSSPMACPRVCLVLLSLSNDASAISVHAATSISTGKQQLCKNHVEGQRLRD